MTLDEQVDYLAKGSVDLIDRKDLRAKLARGKPLTVKVGFDPTAPDLHLGHTVVIRKMKHFQQLGHRVIFVIGDFTGMIGDPTGKKITRPPLTHEEILANAKTYERRSEERRVGKECRTRGLPYEYIHEIANKEISRRLKTINRANECPT